MMMMMMKVLLPLCMVALGMTQAADPDYSCAEEGINYLNGDLLSTKFIPDVKNFAACMEICKQHAKCQAIVFDKTVGKTRCYMKSKRYSKTASLSERSTASAQWSAGNKVCNKDPCTTDFCKPCSGVKDCEFGTCSNAIGGCTCMSNARLNTKDKRSCVCKQGYIKKGGACVKGRVSTKEAHLKKTEKHVCSGAKVHMGNGKTVDQCAKACVRISATFRLGRDATKACHCHIEKDCTQTADNDFDLYAYQAPKHGEWSVWGNWTDCSQPCGGGKETRTRTCEGRENGGKRCQGKKKEKQPCNIQACPTKFKVKGKLGNKNVLCKPCPCKVSFWAKPGRSTNKETLTEQKICKVDAKGKVDDTSCKTPEAGATRKGGFTQYSLDIENTVGTTLDSEAKYKMKAKQGTKAVTSEQTVTLKVNGFSPKKTE